MKGKTKLSACNLWYAITLLIAIFFIITPAYSGELRYSTLTYQGYDRGYYFYYPDSLKENKNYPVLIVLHWAMQNGKQAAQNWGIMDLAERKGFVALFPNALYGEWNDGRDASILSGGRSRPDDVGFLSALISEYTEKYKADASRIYILGVSFGGTMALRAGCEISRQLAGIGVILASLPKPLAKGCMPDKALPVFIINSTDDTVIPLKGGSVKIAGKKFGEVVPVTETMDTWLLTNGCSHAPFFGERQEYKPEKNVKGIRTEFYSQCSSGKPVQLFLVDGGQHNVPSLKRNRKIKTEESSGDFNPIPEIWNFFDQYGE